ncbi:MAG: ATP12 family protein [Pseudomonadota bacterium]
MKRFWRTVTASAVDGGWQVALDDRPIRTPGKVALVLPNAAMAEAMAAEWAAVGDTVDPTAMPVTRAANTAIDRVVPHYALVVDEVAGFGETDLLCYRAPAPEGLVARQRKAWDPLLDWAAESYGARLTASAGVMFAAQDAAAIAALRAAVGAHGPWRLTALHELVTISGSLVLGLAVSAGRLEAEACWRLSRIDEDWNIEEWGADDEAAAVAQKREAALLGAARILSMLEVA